MATRRNDEKYAAILSAATRVIGEYGYHNAQVSRIAKAAGVADGTVYLYFKNKEDILISILRQAIGQIVDEISVVLERPAPPYEKLREFVHFYFSQLGSHPELAMVTQVHLRQADVHIRREIGDILRPLNQALERLVEEGVETDKFSKMDTRIARRMIFGTIDETVTAWILKGGKYDLTELVNPVVHLLRFGLHGAPDVECDERSRILGEYSSSPETDF